VAVVCSHLLIARRFFLFSCTLKMEAIRSSETSVYTIYTGCQIPEDGILQCSEFKWAQFRIHILSAHRGSEFFLSYTIDHPLRRKQISETWGFHIGDFEDYCPLRCDAFYDRLLITLQRNLYPTSSG
jgi:hypothetical protein